MCDAAVVPAARHALSRCVVAGAEVPPLVAARITRVRIWRRRAHAVTARGRPPRHFSAPPPCHASTRRHPPFSQCVLPVAGGGGKRKRQAASSCRSSTHQQCGSEDAGHPNGQRRSFGGCRRTDQRLQAAAPLRFGPCASQTQWPTHEPEGWQEGAGTRRGHPHDAAHAPQRPRRGGAGDTSHTGPGRSPRRWPAAAPRWGTMPARPP